MCLVLGVAAAADAPALVRCEPKDAAIDVPVDVGVIRFHFDRNMRTDSWTLWQTDRGRFPPMKGDDAAAFRDPRCLEVRVERLEPATLYAIQLNSAKRQGLLSAEGVALPLTVVTFRTAGGAPPPPAPPPSARGDELAGAPMDLGPPRADANRQWTVVAYLSADNNLEMWGLWELNEIESCLPDGVDVIALIDRSKRYTDMDGDWTGARVYRLRRGSDIERLESEALLDLGEVNTADPRLLHSFVAGALRAFPAERHALILWDHGFGWALHSQDEDAPGAQGGQADMTTPDIRRAVGGALRTAGVAKFDILYLHMCLMMQIEIAAEVQALADFYIASEASVIAKGLTYTAWIPLLGQGLAPREVCRRAVEFWRDNYERNGRKDQTVSVVDLSKVPEVTAALEAFAGGLGGAVGASWPAISRALFFGESYNGRGDYRAGRHALASVDILDLLARLRGAVPGFPAAEAQRLEAAVAASLVGNYAGRQRRLSRGLACYAPVRADLYRPDYAANAFAAAAPSWPGLLARLHERQRAELVPPRILDVRMVDVAGNPTTFTSGLDAASVRFTVEGSNILWATATQVKPIDNPKGLAVMYRVFLVDTTYDTRRREAAAEAADAIMPQFADGRNELGREVGGIHFRITDGEAAFDATIDYSDPGDVVHMRVPAIYAHPKVGRFPIQMFFNVNWSQPDSVIALIPQKGGGYSPMPFVPDPEGEVTLVHEVLTEDGQATLVPTGTLRWRNGLEMFPVFQQPGTYGLLIEAESIGGVSGKEVLRYEQRANPQFDEVVRTGGRFEAGDLCGAWEMQIAAAQPDGGGIAFQPVPVDVTIEPGRKRPNMLRYALRNRESGETEEAIGLLDNRGATTLVLFEQTGDGETVRASTLIAFRVLEQGAPTFLMKDIRTGVLFRLVPKGGLPAPGPGREPRPAPVPPVKPPAPAPAAESFDGTWTRPDGWVMIIQGNQWQAGFGGIVTDRGTFSVSGKVIKSTSAFSGMTTDLTFVLTAKTLTLTDPFGNAVEWNRSR